MSNTQYQGLRTRQDFSTTQFNRAYCRKRIKGEKKRRTLVNMSRTTNVKLQMLGRAEPREILLCKPCLPHKRICRCTQQWLPNQENPHHSLHRSSKVAEVRSDAPDTGAIITLPL